MEKEASSLFRETPKTKVGWWAMWLGLSPILTMPLLGIFASVVRPMIDKASTEHIGALIGFCIGILFFALSLLALTAGIIAYKKGERSWGIWVGFIPAILLLIMLVGEFVFPH